MVGNCSPSGHMTLRMPLGFNLSLYQGRGHRRGGAAPSSWPVLHNLYGEVGLGWRFPGGNQSGGQVMARKAWARREGETHQFGRG